MNQQLENKYKELGIDKKVYEFGEKIEASLKERFEEIDRNAELNQMKVIAAMQKNKVSAECFNISSGYGYNDMGRDTLEKVYADCFGGEDALVRPQITCGTHALALALMSNLRPGDELLSPVGKPYDTLIDVIFKEGIGSLKDFKINYRDIELKDNDFDYAKVEEELKNNKPRMVYVQRSRGYTTRDSLSIDKIEKLIKFVKNIDKDVLVMVDNCYGEFVELREPCDVGADVMVGSLIKNAGAGIAPTGAYIVGTKYAIEQISSRFIAPSIGLEVGSYAGNYTPFFQGCFLAPHTVLNALKGNILFGRVAEKFGISSLPKFGDMPHDIVRTLQMGSADKLIEFCRLVQKFSPVDSNVVPFPWDMPGYNNQIIMASGSFTQGSSIELSADGPIREPYYCYMQGGLTYEHVKILAIEFATIYLNK